MGGCISSDSSAVGGVDKRYSNAGGPPNNGQQQQTPVRRRGGNQLGGADLGDLSAREAAAAAAEARAVAAAPRQAAAQKADLSEYTFYSAPLLFLFKLQTRALFHFIHPPLPLTS